MKIFYNKYKPRSRRLSALIIGKFSSSNKPSFCLNNKKVILLGPNSLSGVAPKYSTNSFPFSMLPSPGIFVLKGKREEGQSFLRIDQSTRIPLTLTIEY